MVDDLVLAGGGPALNVRLAAAREAAAIVHSSTHDAWVVLAHGEVLAGFRDSRLSSDRVTAFEHLARRRPAAFQTVVDVLSGWMVFRDPPAHTRLRQPVQAAFTPRRMARLAPAVTAIIDDLLDPVAEGGGADLREALAVPLPAIVIAELLGVPRSDRALFQRWSNELAGIVFAASFSAADDVAALAGASSFATYFGDLVEHYRTRPADNLMSAIIAASDEGGEGLRPAEVVGACALLLFAGHETTTSFLANALWTLFGHPAELDSLRNRREVDVAAVDELMRFAGPGVAMVRRATTSFRWRDLDIAAGDTVYLCMAAANRDPEVFSDPATLTLSRNPNPHLGFGWGLHYCLGAPLARMEAALALRRILDRFPDLEPVGTAQWSGGVLGQSSGPVPVRVRQK